MGKLSGKPVTPWAPWFFLSLSRSYAYSLSHLYSHIHTLSYFNSLSLPQSFFSTRYTTIHRTLYICLTLCISHPHTHSQQLSLSLSFKNGPFTASFFFIFVISIHLIMNKILLMTGFEPEPRTPGVGSDHNHSHCPDSLSLILARADLLLGEAETWRLMWIRNFMGQWKPKREKKFENWTKSCSLHFLFHTLSLILSSVLWT